MAQPLLIGVLALTGSFEEHQEILHKLGATTRQVRTPAQLDGLDGIVLPGGESTAMGIVEGGLFSVLRQRIDGGLPVYGTCAGMILLANDALGQRIGGQPLVGGLDITVCRNYFGAQVSSFEVPLTVDDEPFQAVFIRAPAVLKLGPNVEALATLTAPPCTKARGEVVAFLKTETTPVVAVAVRQGSILATAFHPELTMDLRWHARFLKMCADAKAAPRPPNASS
ncbi:class I glutamine amidotransferase-like protein [Pelagophyceae sp. CCMP2097]|nr:class I glutamine amidotransferase-like protein [Pelagophyceae sp. CCMP2097]